jgi:hypothetical protein
MNINDLIKEILSITSQEKLRQVQDVLLLQMWKLGCIHGARTEREYPHREDMGR